MTRDFFNHLWPLLWRNREQLASAITHKTGHLLPDPLLDELVLVLQSDAFRDFNGDLLQKKGLLKGS